ncbi:MAG: branched-chain amino acid ABC transporter substrate-binding protein [Rhodospirillales bacterium 20-60-12]|nr:MAG: branched-chain amino acid ABC transporter substrate-binding protein [Rhodospirillales bacterium 20-60-12]HQT68309.1 branched-chain amino acid ABC transporter ATP-binding protein/permease [Acetobacteraceae bacterium]
MRPIPTLTARRRGFLLIGLGVILLALPLLDPNQADIDIAANCTAYSALALGLNIVVGFAGLLDLGYAAFFAIGAYAYGILASYQLQPPWTPDWQFLADIGFVSKLTIEGNAVVHFTFPFWLMLPGSALIAACFGIAFGAPTLRLKGDYLAIVTLGFGEIVPIVARNWTSLTNGAEGLNGVAPPHAFGYSFGINSIPYYYVGLAIVGLLLLVSVRLRDSATGRAWMAIREDEVAAGAMGIHTTRLKLLAFAIGAGFAGMTGTFYIAKLQTATPDMFDLPVSVMVLVMIVLGGMGSVWGAILGAVFLSLLQSLFLPALNNAVQGFGALIGSGFLQQLQITSASELIFGIILVGMMLYRRQGLIPAARKPPLLTTEQMHASVTRGAIDLPVHPARHARGAKPDLMIEGLTVRYGGLHALKSISMRVEPGQIVAIIGPNGSGKSTLFNAITGLVKPFDGSIRFAGEELIGLRADQILKRGIARSFQNIRLFPQLSVIDNVMIGQHARLKSGPLGAVLGLPSGRAEERAARVRAMALLGMFGNRLTPRADQLVSSLSYANRRRVEIARALASAPRLLMLDEPTAGMNPAESIELAEQIGELRALGLTILLVEHKLDVVVRLADHVIVLDHGDKLAEGKADEIRRNEAVLTAYLGRAAAHV